MEVPQESVHGLHRDAKRGHQVNHTVITHLGKGTNVDIGRLPKFGNVR